MNTRREELIRSIFGGFCRLLDRYKETRHRSRSSRQKAICKQNNAFCDFYYLGLLFHLALQRNLYPPPLPPYIEQSLVNIKSTFSNLLPNTDFPGGIHLQCGMEIDTFLTSKLTWGELGLSLGYFKRKQADPSTRGVKRRRQTD